MYRIEYDIETGLVHNLAIVEDENYPETLIDGAAYYEGDIPEDIEGYEKVLYYKLVNTQENPEGVSTFAVWEGNLYAEYKPIEGWVELADAKDVADLFIQSQKPKGLRFKAGDNTVFAKTMKALALGTDDFTVCVVARTEGSNGVANSIIGNSKNPYAPNCFRIYGNTTYGSNRIDYLLMQRELDEQSNGLKNSVHIDKQDTTTNLHHIVITRSGTLVTCTINGRLVKSVTQDRVLDFSNFIYDIANTSYFWGGAVFNYAMTQAESNKLLWNGGRYDEVRLPNIYTNSQSTDNILKDPTKIYGGVLYADADVTNYKASKNEVLEITYEIIAKPISYKDTYSIRGYNSIIAKNTFDLSIGDKEVGIYTSLVVCSDATTALYCYTGTDFSTNGGRYKILKIKTGRALLEYKPENIRADRMINTGAAGSDYDLIYSLPTKPTIIYEAPYKDKIVLEDKTTPDFHPIAVGQRCYTSDGKILEAKLPAKGSEWAVSDWKQTSV